MAGQIREARPGDEEGLYALVAQLGHALPPVREAFDATIASYFAGEHPSVFLLVVDDVAVTGAHVQGGGLHLSILPGARARGCVRVTARRPGTPLP